MTLRARTFVVVAILGGVALAAPANAEEWVHFVEETSIRLAGPDASLLAEDLDEKDYAWADLDRDGDVDLVVVRKEPFTSAGKRINVLLMNEDGVLTDRTAEFAVSSSVPGDRGFLTATNDRDVVIVDVDDDGWLDLVTAATISDGDPKHIGHPRVYLNLGRDPGGDWLGLRYEDSWIPAMRSYSGAAGHNPRFCSVAAGDLTGDGRPDLYFGDYDSSEENNPQPPGADFNDRLLVNVDGTRFVDETQQRFSGVIQIIGPDQAFEISAFGAAVAIADINGDRRNDIVKQTALAPPQYVGVAYNSPTDEGFFDDYEALNQGAPYFVSVGDLNNDRKPDLVITDDGQDIYLLNQGVGADGRVDWVEYPFLYEGTAESGFGGNSLIADLDNDGWNDVLVTDVDVDDPGCGRRMSIYHNGGFFPFGLNRLTEETTGACRPTGNDATCRVASIPEPDLRGVHDVAVFDIDGDGLNDMVVGQCSGTRVWMNRPRIVFALPSPLPEVVEPDLPTTVRVRVTPSGDALSPGSEKMFVAIAGGAYAEIPLTALSDNLYEGTLFGAGCLDTVSYYFSAELVRGGTFTFPADAPASTFAAVAAYGTRTLFADGFEGGVSAWTATAAPGANGAWQRVVPTGSVTSGAQAAPGEDSEAGGTRAFVTGDGIPGAGAGESDVDGGPVDLISPPVDMSGSDGWISYDTWAFSAGGAPDLLEIAVTADGATWSTVETRGPGQNGWTRSRFRVSDHVTPGTNVQVRFRIADEPNDSVTEAGVDGFHAGAFACSTCSNAAECDDGLFCNGVEVCDGGICDLGIDPCPGRVCDESADACLDCFEDVDCDDGNFCNGIETCAGDTCVPGGDPCPSSFCDDSLNFCVACLVDADCDDGLFCNGVETCNGGACSQPAEACPGQTCDESANACVGPVTLQPRSGEPLNGLTSEQRERFFTGLVSFDRVLDAGDGLGPIFNQDSCGSCHSNPVGGSGPIAVTRFGFTDPETGAFDPLGELGGSLLQHSSLAIECAETVPAEANVTANRVTPPTLGFGLVEAIDDADLQAAELQPPPGVSGRAHVVEALEAPGVPRVGRFGWKAQVPTVLSFSGDAARNEMGLTNRLLPTENPPNGDLGLLAACDVVADPEDGPDALGFDFIDRVTDFQRFLAPPPQTPRTGMSGENLFNSSGCSACHTPAFTTRDGPSLEAALRNRVLRPYSDFLLHDMGQSADFIEQGDAEPGEIRTPPLWGLRLRNRLWHDGRITSGTFENRVRAAIDQHGALGSEAEPSKLAFDALSVAGQNALIRFLDSLGRAEFDHDGDNDVDLDDLWALEGCFTGPGAFLTPDDACAVFDADRDGDVDVDDRRLFDSAVDADAGEAGSLTLGKSGGMLQLDWSASCNPVDDDYGVYRGTIGGQFDDHVSVACTTGGTTGFATSIPAGDVYFLVVPRNILREGSYGRSSFGGERPPGAGACKAQAVGTCP